MPGFDRTGPNGEGPRTGRGLGKCNPDTKDNNERPEDNPAGRGMRFASGGRGLGRRMRNGRGHRNRGN